MNRFDYLIVGGNRWRLNVSLRLVLVFELVVELLVIDSVAKKTIDRLGVSSKLLCISSCVGLDKLLPFRNFRIISVRNYWSAKNTCL